MSEKKVPLFFHFYDITSKNEWARPFPSFSHCPHSKQKDVSYTFLASGGGMKQPRKLAIRIQPHLNKNRRMTMCATQLSRPYHILKQYNLNQWLWHHTGISMFCGVECFNKLTKSEKLYLLSFHIGLQYFFRAVQINKSNNSHRCWKIDGDFST